MAVMTIHAIRTATADLGTPATSRDRKASLRALPMTGAVLAAAGATCARGDVTMGDSSVLRGVATVTGAFPGTSAWSPPS